MSFLTVLEFPTMSVYSRVFFRRAGRHDSTAGKMPAATIYSTSYRILGGSSGWVVDAGALVDFTVNAERSSQ